MNVNFETTQGASTKTPQVKNVSISNSARPQLSMSFFYNLTTTTVARLMAELATKCDEIKVSQNRSIT